jgi:hypothetical protein
MQSGALPVPQVESASASRGKTTRASSSAIRAVLAAVLVAGTVVLLRSQGLLSGYLALGLSAVLVLAVPTSGQLSRRILLAAALLFGWVPVLWWAPLPVAGLGRVTLLLAITAGAMAAWVGHAENPVARLRLLVPKIALVDALPFVAAGVAATLLRGWWRLGSGETVLAFLSRGWDNSAHFDMVEMIRAHGATIDVLGAPSDGTWKFADYPQSFHVAVAAFMELTGSVVPADARTELVAYLHSVGLVAIVGVAALVAGLCALPSLRRRPLLAAPLAVLTVSGYVLGPGSIALHDGFPNFFLGCVLASVAFLVAVPLRRYVPTLHLAALGGALVAVAHTWVLLGTLVAPAALLAIVVLWRGRHHSSRRKVLFDAAVVLVTLTAAARAAQILTGLRATDVLTTPGGIVPPNLTAVLVLAVLAGVGWIVLGTNRVRAVSHAFRSTSRWLALVPAFGLVTLAGLAAVQLHADGALSYYFWKFATGVELLSVVAFASGIALAARPRRPDQPTRTAVPVLASAAACLVATQAFGLFGPGLARLGIAPVAPGAERYVQMAQESPATVTTAGHLLEVAAQQRVDPQRRFVMLDAGTAAIDPISEQQWLLALTGGWTDASNRQASLLGRTNDTLPELTASAERAPQSDPRAHLVVTGDSTAMLVAGLGDATRATVAGTP